GDERLFQAGHLLDGAFEIGVCAICASAFRRHGIDTGDRLGEQTVNPALFLGTLAPSSGIAYFRCAQQAGTVASVAMFRNHGVRGLGITATRRSSHFHPLAFLTLNANLANWLKAFCNIVV